MLATSQRLFAEAKTWIPGGVNSPVRSFQAVGGTPAFIVKGEGSKVYDVDGNKYIDFLCSWGPLILGHAHPKVISALQDALVRGTSFGAATEAEITMARLITEAFPSIEKVRLVNSGTEATMTAIRLARAFTRRDKIVKFEGCYHGHADPFLVKAGSGLLTMRAPSSEGISSSIIQDTLVLPFNNKQALQTLFQQSGEEIAAVIVEPIAANMGVVLPEEEFLQDLRSLTTVYQSVLIFDEIITGFRVTYGGAQHLYDINPDITCLGKIIGGGLPIGAIGGKASIMDQLAPLGQVYQAGTLSGNPIAVAAGIATLQILKEEIVYPSLDSKANYLTSRIKQAADDNNIPVVINRAGSMFTIFFSKNEVKDYSSAKSSNTKLYAKFFHHMLKEGFYFPPSPFEASFISFVHTEDDLKKTVEVAQKVFEHMRLNTAHS